MVKYELPTSFPHSPPDGYHYETVRVKSSLLSIWTVHRRGFTYNNNSESRCIWGFYNPKTDTYYSPVNSKTVGKEIRVRDTTPYTAMPKPKVKVTIFDFT